MKTIYLDYAAATPMDPEVLAVMEPYFNRHFYNPSATYLAARSVRQKLNDARASVARSLGARPAEIIFTAGATEANNLAIQGIMHLHPGARLLISAIEHESILAPAKLFDHQLVPVTKQGIIDIQKLKSMVDDRTVLVSVMLVNNELGSIQPLRQVSQILNMLSNERLARGNKLPLYLHTDAAQAGNYLDLHASRLGVDLLSINGGKIYGPKQSGALYVKAGTKLEPLIVGGGQELGLRSGTENVAFAAGLAAALSRAQSERLAEAKRIGELRQYFNNQLGEHLPQASLNGSPKHSAPHIVSVVFPGVDNERLMFQLDEAGVMAAVGSACSASSDKPSHVLSAIGLSDEQARSTIRFSLGRGTSKDDLDKTIRLLRRFTDSAS